MPGFAVDIKENTPFRLILVGFGCPRHWCVVARLRAQSLAPTPSPPVARSQEGRRSEPRSHSYTPNCSTTATSIGASWELIPIQEGSRALFPREHEPYSRGITSPIPEGCLRRAWRAWLCRSRGGRVPQASPRPTGRLRIARTT